MSQAPQTKTFNSFFIDTEEGGKPIVSVKGGFQFILY